MLRSMKAVRIEMSKWPDRPHWRGPAQRLGEDEHGTWLRVAAETVFQRGDEPPRPLPHGFVALVPHDEWWMVEYYRDHPEYDVYVNIGTPPTWDDETVRQVDLDLDVVRHHDGSTRVLDIDEFRANQQELGYPPELIENTKAAVWRAFEAVASRVEPFDAAAERWWNADPGNG